MSNWSSYQFTCKGEQLRAKVEAGKCKLTLTKIKIGNGNVALSDIKDMSDLKSPQLVLGISSCAVSAEDDRVCEVVGIASSSNVENAFSVTEMGLYANDPDVGEILYLVEVDTSPDDMPNKNAQSPVTLTYQIELVTSNTANVTAMVSPAGLVTVKMMSAHRTAAELDHPEKSVHKKHLHQDAYESPALTGTPTAPTAGKGTNNGQIASTAFVAQAIAALVHSAPGALDTLQELASALGNDANFAATVTNALAGKLGKTEKAASAGNSDTLGGQSLQWIIDQINAAKTGIVAGNLAQNGWVKFANGLIVQWGSVYGETVTTPDQSISITLPVSISMELFSCGNVNVAGGNTDYNWKNKHAIVSTIYNQGTKKLNVSSTFFGKTYITQWLLIGV